MSTFNLTAREHKSRVLSDWMATRPGSAGRVSAAITGADSEVVRWGGIEWSDFVRGGMAGGLPALTESTARSISAVVACTNLIGGTMASLPLHFYVRTAEGRERANSGLPESLWWLFNERPHPQWPAAAWWQYMSDARLLHGDAFAIIRRGGLAGSMPVALEPWHPGFVDVDKDDIGRLYHFRDPDNGVVTTLRPDDVLHIPGPGFDGKRSLSQLRYALANPAGIARAADMQAGSFVNDGARPDFAIEVPGNLSADQQELMRSKWIERHTGQGAKKAPVVLSGGIKLHQLTMTMEDAQLLATRAFQIEEICRIFGVPPHMVGHTDKTTSWGSGIEQQAMGFVTYTMQRHLVAFEQEINHKFFKTSRNFSEFLTAGLLRGDTKTRFEAYRIALGRAGEPAWMRPSEVRKLENLPADDGIDAVNMPQEAANAPEQ